MTGAPLRATVVICTWNRARLVDSCLEALSSQLADPDHWEVVVADDGSTDDTESVVKRHAGDFPVSLEHLALPHAGLNAARNAGIRASSGHVVVFIDDDEIPLPTHVQRVLQHFSDDPGLDGVGGPLVHDLDTVHRTCANCSFDSAAASGAGLGTVDALVGGNMAIRKECFEQSAVGPFDDSLSGRGDESEWFHRARPRRFLFDPELVIRHRRMNFTLATTARTAFRQGRAYPRYRELVNEPYEPRLRSAWRHVRHAAGRRCAYGLVRASREAGAWAEVMSARLKSSLKQTRRRRAGETAESQQGSGYPD